MPRPVLKTAILAVLAIAILQSHTANALPRYTAQYGQSCILCHVNPSGGGMRSEYASQFLVPEEIAAKGWSTGEMDYLSPRISPNIVLGVDLRSLLYQQEGGNGSGFAMQGDLYVNVEMSSRFAAYVEQGLNGSGEIFGIGRADVLDSYFKAGRFIPDYGWRFSDHGMFNRRYLTDSTGSDSPAGLYSEGFEVGISPGGLTASAALLGGSQNNGDNYSGRALYQFYLGDFNVGAGASLLRRQLGTDARRAAGAFWYLALGPVTWLGQIDETKQNNQLGNMVSQEVALTVSQGYDLRLTYNFQDPDRGLQNGSRQKYGTGISAMPRPYFGWSLMANYWDNDQGDAVVEDDRFEGEMMVHFFY
ncbi:MAG: hypothetical protein GY780_11705 [bacterium]|nr:hypothetical protein [bacterium]